ncbi:MAG: bifunctional UDP-N-acetylglucosamine diphosphorylase/glucosamine-1-phosphate N-acetyltransferase GlmU [Acidobacteriota bacterium]
MSRAAVILAAGQGTRMRSELPKVLHEAGGRPLLQWVVEAARGAGCDRLVLVVGHGHEQVRSRLEAALDRSDDLHWVLQKEQLGTGHAVLQARSVLGEESGAGAGVTFVLSGDAPFVSSATLERLATTAEEGWGAVACARLDDPGSLGRTVIEDGVVTNIIESVDATAEELANRWVNSGHYAVRFPDIFALLDGVGSANRQGEIYLTDAVVAANAQGRVAAFELEDPREAWGVNTRADLAAVHGALVSRKVSELQDQGVTFIDPARVQIAADAVIGADTVVHPDCCLLSGVRVGSGSVLHQGTWLKDAELGDGVEVFPYSLIEGATVASACSIGPFARLRPGARLAEQVKIGNFVEVKKSSLGPGTKASHLAYLGDATIGAGSNIGAGTITCNYDGENKHVTEIGDGVFIGSDTMLVAPVRIGDQATTAAGSTVTQDVPDGSLAVGRARQKNIAGWAQRKGRTSDSESQ